MKKAGKSFKWLVLLIPVHILLLLYFLLAVYYNHKFSLGTWINGIYCTGKSVEEVNGLLIANTVLPDITVTDMEGKVEVISLEDIDCRIDYTVHLKEFIRKQNPFLWGLRLLTPEAAQVRPMIFCDRDVLIEAVWGADPQSRNYENGTGFYPGRKSFGYSRCGKNNTIAFGGD